ncbi:MAG: phage replisome organizer N-terminal domain-containing protein [Clostridium sp.]|uniref:phage replisome organizer N-terminal domain-containing protein n=1 Tax=Clostridium sp. TaxID=1506 RepID=UPI0025C3D370|nr:phage replisome organizer N-terminal domain-containing protein [Clostridium sp.]MCE5221888.1 phage replisome organizer N-terminal domain-containing protein [Clostridium sp.]
MTEKKYYWLKLQNNFFEKDEIKVIESRPNGEKHINFYLKLLLKSISTEGKLLFRDVIPYTPEMLASITNTDVDTVKVAIDLFLNLGLMERLDDGALFMIETQNMIGSETQWAVKKREYRKNLDNKSKDNVLEVSETKNTLSDKSKSIEKEIDKDKEIDKELKQEECLSVVVHSNVEVFKHFEKCGFIVSSKLMEFIAADIEIYSAQWLVDAADECVKRGKLNNYGYLTGILQNWKTKGRDKKETNNKNSNNKPKSLRFNNFEAREYDYDDLEKKLLGWDN